MERRMLQTIRSEIDEEQRELNLRKRQLIRAEAWEIFLASVLSAAEGLDKIVPQLPADLLEFCPEAFNHERLAPDSVTCTNGAVRQTQKPVLFTKERIEEAVVNAFVEQDKITIATVTQILQAEYNTKARPSHRAVSDALAKVADRHENGTRPFYTLRPSETAGDGYDHDADNQNPA